MNISVIVPAYNAQKTIERCLGSLLVESDGSVEVVCVDDGSTDKTAEIVQEIAEKDSRCKLVRQENRGASSARNTGLTKATGEYIMFCDADDRFGGGGSAILLKTLRSIITRI